WSEELRARVNITIDMGSAVWALTKAVDGGMNFAEQIRDAAQDWLDGMGLPVDASVELMQVEQARGPRFIDTAVIVNGVRCGFSKRQLAWVYESSTRREVADHTAGVKAARELLGEAAANKGESQTLAQALLAELVVE